MTDYGGKTGEILHELNRFVAFSCRFRRCSDHRIARHGSQSNFDLQKEMKRLNDNRLHDKALALFDTYEKSNKVKLSEAVVTQALKACARLGDVQRGSRLYKTVASRIEGDPYTMTSLIQLFSKCNI